MTLLTERERERLLSPVQNKDTGVDKKRKRILTSNRRSLYQLGKLHHAIKETERMDIDILGIADVEWKGHGDLQTTNGHIYYSCAENGKCKYGVAFIIKKIKTKVPNVVQLSERILLLQLRAQRKNTNLFQIYAPTGNKCQDEIEDFYHQLEEALRNIDNKDVTLILGDLNVKVNDSAVDHPLRIKLKKIKPKVRDQKLNIRRLKEEAIKDRVKKDFRGNIKKATELNKQERDVYKKWENIKSSLLASTQDKLKNDKQTPKKWMTNEILPHRKKDNKKDTTFQNIEKSIKP
ncbi:hypothetical protein ILUMI_24831 [Ignelater luminosus]|uniref:Endonuclease/exonuclease/phosphatase domain-containing protein n=1 Tax=Ignelater luminosus TaxID=2038154 RepID=A0A8K0C8E5_IGNLU|nr:hypothetical protein ILUMI_24831 [Ignelater luminosus]